MGCGKMTGFGDGRRKRISRNFLQMAHHFLKKHRTKKVGYARKQPVHYVHRVRRRRVGGANFLQKAKSFLKKHQVLSRVGEFAIPFVPGPYQPLAQTAVSITKRAGYGRRRVHHMSCGGRTHHMHRGGSHHMHRMHRGGMAVLPPAVFNTATATVGIPKF
jgi:hypothetical protein